MSALDTAAIRERFEQVHPCPRLAASDGETMCASCHDSLAWLANEFMGRLLDEVESLRLELNPLGIASAAQPSGLSRSAAGLYAHICSGFDGRCGTRALTPESAHTRTTPESDPDSDSAGCLPVTREEEK